MQKERLCSELRDKILNTVSKNGGHLASNLGIIELTVALMSVFDFDKDKIVFDVGHQAYAYKLLTGRYDMFDSLRQKGGISGFPRISVRLRYRPHSAWQEPGTLKAMMII